MSGSSTSRKRMFSLQGASLATATLLIVGLLVAAGQTTATASCRAFHLYGTARGNDGAALKRYDVAVFTHQSDRLLKHVRATRTGAFALTVCKGSRLTTYAHRHGGRVNFDVVAHIHGRKGAFHVKTVSVPFGASKVKVPSHFIKAKTVAGGPSGGGDAVGGGPMTGTVDVGYAVVSPAVMAIEAVPHMRVEYDLSTDTVRSIQAVVGVKTGVYEASGSMSVAGGAGFASGKTLRTKSGQTSVARVIKPELSVHSQYTCYTTSWYEWETNQPRWCTTSSSGNWTGRTHIVRGTYHGCSSGKAPVVFGNNHNTRYWKVGRGVTYTTEVEGGVLGNKLKVSAEYKGGTSVVYALDQTATKHSFCLGGNGKYVSRSPKLYISGIESTAGGGGCYAMAAKATDGSTTSVPVC